MPKAINYKSRIRRALDRRTDFEVEIVHVLDRLKLRYPKMTDLEDIVLRVVRSLAHCTPHDWRFTDSVVPLASRKLGSRPNAIVDTVGALWVRQPMNWVDLKNTSAPEYYMFQPITRNYGITKNTFRIFSYDANGNLKTHQEETINCESHHPGIKDFKPGFAPSDILKKIVDKAKNKLHRK